MGNFDVSLATRGGVPVIPPAGLILEPMHWTGSMAGGWGKAEIEARGPELALASLRGWLRYKVQVRGAGGLLWEGYINEISLRLGSATVTLSTERLYNAVNVIYSFTGDDGGGDTALTGWLVDSLSADTFGRKDALHSAGGEITKEQAEALRQTVLKSCAKASRPEISVGGDGQEYAATLYCDGPFADLDWRYYEDAAGYEAHEETGGGRVLLGWAYTANTIGFVGAPNNRVLDFGGKLAALDEGDQVKVSGSASNNGVKVVKNPPDGETQSYTAGTISFDPTDDIKDSALGMGFIRSKEGIKVTGSPNNDGYYFIGEVTGADRVEASAGYGALPIQSDSAGPSVTIDMAHNAETETALAHEVPGANVTLTAYGQMVGMGFQVVNGPWQAGEVAIHIARHGAPTDDVIVELRADNGGNPGSMIAYGVLPYTDIPPKERAWRSVQMLTPVTLSNGVNYHITVSRNGAAHVDNYFSLSLDTDASYQRGNLRLWDGSAWQTRATAAHMPFKVWGTMDTTEKISEIVSAIGGTFTDVFAPDAAGVRTRKIRDGRTTAGEEVRQLIQMGNAAGQRMTAISTGNGTLVLGFTSGTVTNPLVWTRDGKLRYANGGPFPPGVLPLGRWLQIEQLTAGDWQADAARFYIDSAEYDARTGQWTPRPPEALDPFDIGTQQG